MYAQAVQSVRPAETTGYQLFVELNQAPYQICHGHIPSSLIKVSRKY
jgi:hypothetical protein